MPGSLFSILSGGLLQLVGSMSLFFWMHALLRRDCRSLCLVSGQMSRELEQELIVSLDDLAQFVVFLGAPKDLTGMPSDDAEAAFACAWTLIKGFAQELSKLWCSNLPTGGFFEVLTSDCSELGHLIFHSEVPKIGVTNDRLQFHCAWDLGVFAAVTILYHAEDHRSMIGVDLDLSSTCLSEVISMWKASKANTALRSLQAL